MNLWERERKFDVVAFYWTLIFGFAVGTDRTLQALLERYVATHDEIDSLAYNSFRNWFTPALIDFLHELLDDQIEELSATNDRLRGRLSRFRDVLVPDASFISLVQSAADVYNAPRDDQAGAKLHLTESLSTGLPTRWELTAGTVHERSQLRSGSWVAHSLILFDLGFYDFWLFDRIDANDGWFVTRLKANANPECIEALRTWRGNAISLEGKPLQNVIDNLERDVIDMRAELSFLRRQYRGSRRRATRLFRVIGIWNENEEKYRLYITNLPVETYSAPDIARLYRARWEIELLFKELKSVFGLDKMRVSNPVIIEALILVAALSLVVSRVILEQLRELEAQEARAAGEEPAAARARLSRHRCSEAIKRQVSLIHLYLMCDLGYGWPDLDAVLRLGSRDPNPHRDRLLDQVQFSEFPVELA